MTKNKGDGKNVQSKDGYALNRSVMIQGINPVMQEPSKIIVLVGVDRTILVTFRNHFTGRSFHLDFQTPHFPSPSHR